MLSKEMVVTLVGVGFDPYLGFYHQPRYGRPALALDLMEEFRPLVADSVAISLINTGELRPVDFIARAGAVALTESGRHRVLEAYERRLDTLVTHPRFGYAISYRRIFEVQARLLARCLMGEIAAYPAFCTR
jgi:CRISPR-associated protein Cas1